MIVVRVELHSATTGQVTEIARMHISNQGGMGADNYADYLVGTLFGRGQGQLAKSSRNRRYTRKGEVLNHKRKENHVWNLITKALKTLRYGE